MRKTLSHKVNRLALRSMSKHRAQARFGVAGRDRTGERIMTDDARDSLLNQIRCNSNNFGELGRYIRLETLHEILDRFTIVDNDLGHTQHNRVTKIRQLLNDMRVGNDREVLREIYQVVWTHN